jgi:DNA-binding transcriptional LysR family regulator
VISLATEDFYAVMPPGFPLISRPGINLEEVSEFALIALPKEAQTRCLFDSLASAAGFALQHAVMVNPLATLMQCVHAGVGIVIVPATAVPAT